MPSLQDFFTNKVVVISGAASGIGAGLAHCFASLGCNLALCDIDTEALAEVADTITKQHPTTQLHIETIDVSRKAAWQSFLCNAASQLNHIDIMINNAGIEGSCQPVWATDDDVLHKVMDVNFYGMVYGSKVALPYLVKRPWAALVNVSSIFGLLAPPNTADYCASKFAIRGYTESLRAELAQIHPQVQVQLVHPGGINTNITRLPQSQKFKERFLTEEPSAIALHIAKSIMHNKARIIFGNQAGRTSLASRILPLKWLSKLLAKEIDGLDMKEDYTVDHDGFSLPKDSDKKTD